MNIGQCIKESTFNGICHCGHGKNEETFLTILTEQYKYFYCVNCGTLHAKDLKNKNVPGHAIYPKRLEVEKV